MSRVPLGNCFHSPSTCTFNMGTPVAVALIVVSLPLSLAPRRQAMRERERAIPNPAIVSLYRFPEKRARQDHFAGLAEWPHCVTLQVRNNELPSDVPDLDAVSGPLPPALGQPSWSFRVVGDAHPRNPAGTIRGIFRVAAHLGIVAIVWLHPASGAAKLWRITGRKRSKLSGATSIRWLRNRTIFKIRVKTSMGFGPVRRTGSIVASMTSGKETNEGSPAMRPIPATAKHFGCP